MASPSLTGLPTELLHHIITYGLPEGLEALALTCRTLYGLCAPFLQHHNQLRTQFRNFGYREVSREPSSSPIKTAFGLLTRIAAEPVVARYIKHADLSRDSFPHRASPPCQLEPDVHHGEPVAKLLADSSYLRQAGLDWKEYFALIGEDCRQDFRYSQYAATFVLTLLPNVETLILPRLWKPLEKTHKVLDVIVRNSMHPECRGDRPSLAQVTRFESFSSLGAGHCIDLERAVPFLSLPRVRSFRGPSIMAIGVASTALASTAPYRRCGEALETAHLLSCCMDEVAIAEFLRHAPRLRTLKYSHSTRGGHQDWDICRFATAIERETGSHLEELSISIRDLHGTIAPGKASMRRFQKLRKLEFPLEIAMCNVLTNAALASTPSKDETDQELNKPEPFIGDLVPATVSELSLLSRGAGQHATALMVMFSGFAAKKDCQLPALKEIHISCPISPCADDMYKEQCIKLIAETERAGVVSHLVAWPNSMKLTWNGE